MSVNKMKKLTAFAYKSDAHSLMRRLTQLRCVDVRQADLGDRGSALELSRFDCADERRALDAEIKELVRVLKELYPYSVRKKSLIRPRIEVDMAKFTSGDGIRVATRALDEGKAALDRLEGVKKRTKEVDSLYESMLPFAEYPRPLSMCSTEYTSVILGAFPPKADFERIEKEIEHYYAIAERIFFKEKAGLFARIICHVSDERDVLQALSSLGFCRISFPEGAGRAADELIKLGRERKALADEEAKIKRQLAAAARSINELEILYDVKKTTLNVLEQQEKLGATEYSVVLEAWVPEGAQTAVANCISSFDAAFELRDPKDYEKPPTLLSNNGFAKNFEWVIGMYSYPKYGSFDPTFIMSIFYFILFGVMFADVGYGLLLVAAGFGGVKLLRPQDGMKRFLLMFGICGISCTVMGAVFGGWFGDLPFALMTNLFGIENAKMAVPFFNGMWFNPLDDPMQFLIVSLGIGAAHLIAGMAVKFYVICKSGRIFDAIFDIGSWWVLFAGIALIFVDQTVGLCTAGAGVLMLVLTQGRHEKSILMKALKGVGSLYDLVSYLSDLLSYSRILALGMVAGVIGQVVNMITGLGSNFFGFIIMVAVLLVGHLLNLAINVLGTFVHTSRLQYIEFFNKFYEDGGVQFQAAEPSEKYTIEK